MLPCPDDHAVRERESNPVSRFCVITWTPRSIELLSKPTLCAEKPLTTKRGLVTLDVRTTYCRVCNHIMRVHDGHGRERGRQGGPDRFHATSNSGSYLKGLVDVCRRRGVRDGGQGTRAYLRSRVPFSCQLWGKRVDLPLLCPLSGLRVSHSRGELIAVIDGEGRRLSVSASGSFEVQGRWAELRFVSRVMGVRRLPIVRTGLARNFRTPGLSWSERALCHTHVRRLSELVLRPR